MKDLHPQFEMLISYADGVADAEMQKRAIELINSDSEAASFYQSLQATALDYEEIYADQLAVPQHLIDEVRQARPDALEAPLKHSQRHSQRRSQQQPGQQHFSADASHGRLTASNTDGSHGNTSVSGNASGGFGRLALAASLIGGLIGGAVIYAAVTGNGAPEYNDTSVANQAVVPEWVRLVADYHRLYVRETVTAGAVSSAEAVSQQVSDVLQTEFTVPVLENYGMDFRRAQWLAIDDQPLLQLAYLPETGKPLAVCVLKKNTAQNTAAEYGETGGMQYVHWQSGEHAVVIVGKVSQEVMRGINDLVEQQIL